MSRELRADEIAFLEALGASCAATPDLLAQFVAGGLESHVADLLCAELCSSSEARAQLAAQCQEWDTPQLHNLPPERTPLIGRRKALADIEQLMSHERLITISATGGFGKSRVAREVGRKAFAKFADGVWFVPAGTLETKGDLSAAIIAAVGGSPDEDAADWLADKEVLLIIDGLDRTHLAPHIRDLLTAPRLRIICTSRSRLNTEGELVYRLTALSEGVVNDFALKSSQVKWSTGDTGQLALRLCGVPIALCLAAGCLSHESVPALLDALDQHVPRTATLSRANSAVEAVLSHSISLLPHTERRLLVGCAAFSSRFDADLAHQIAGEGKIQALVEMGLLEASEGVYWLHDLVRDFLRATQLDPSDRAHLQIADLAHMAHFSNLASSVGDSWRSSGDWATSLAALVKFLPDFRKSLRLAVRKKSHEDIQRIYRGLSTMFFELGYLEDMQEVIDAALASAQRQNDQPLLARIYGLRGAHELVSGEREAAEQSWRQRLALSVQLQEHDAIADTYSDLSDLEWGRGNRDEAIRLTDLALKTAYDHKLTQFIGGFHAFKALMLIRMGRVEESKEHAKIAEEQDDDEISTQYRMYRMQVLGEYASDSKDDVLAIRYTQELLKLAIASQRTQHIAGSLKLLGNFFERKGDLERASHCFAGSLSLRSKEHKRHRQRAQGYIDDFIERQGKHVQPFVDYGLTLDPLVFAHDQLNRGM